MGYDDIIDIVDKLVGELLRRLNFLELLLRKLLLGCCWDCAGALREGLYTGPVGPLIWGTTGATR